MAFEKTKYAIKQILKMNDDTVNSLPLIHLVTKACAWGFVDYENIEEEIKNILKYQMNYLKEKGRLDESI